MSHCQLLTFSILQKEFRVEIRNEAFRALGETARTGGPQECGSGSGSSGVGVEGLQDSRNPGLRPRTSLPLPAGLTPNPLHDPSKIPAVPTVVEGPHGRPGPRHLSSSCSAWGPGPSTRCRQSGCRRVGERRRGPARPWGRRSSGAAGRPGSPCG